MRKLLVLRISPLACIEHFLCALQRQRLAGPTLPAYSLYPICTVIAATYFQEQMGYHFAMGCAAAFA
jgi:hypothetical protein